MNEFSRSDVPDIHNIGLENLSNFKPETGMSFSDAVKFISDVYDRVSQFGAEFNSYKDCYDQTPAYRIDRGEWTGDRAESKFIPSETTPEGLAAKEKLAQYGLDGIDYVNAEPDFSNCSEATVEIDHMTEHRYDYYNESGEQQSGNFSQADEKCAKMWNEQMRDGKTDWDSESVAKYRQTNNLSWHERCDTKTMDLVPREIHEYFGHLGGCAECKVRDNSQEWGGFDE